MAPLTLTIKSTDKASLFAKICSEYGYDAEELFVMLKRYADASESDGDPFYSKSNVDNILKAASQLKSGKGQIHDIIEVGEDD